MKQDNIAQSNFGSISLKAPLNNISVKRISSEEVNIQATCPLAKTVSSLTN